MAHTNSVDVILPRRDPRINPAVTSIDPRYIRDLLPGSGEHDRFRRSADTIIR